MMQIMIGVHNFGDLKPLFPELTPLKHFELLPSYCAILERGTKEGNASLMLCALVGDGSVYYLQLTAAMWHLIDAIVRSNEQRWTEMAGPQ